MEPTSRRIGPHPLDRSQGTLLRDRVLDLIQEERGRQIDTYGRNDSWPLGFGCSVSSYPWLSPFTHASASMVQEQFRLDYKAYENEQGYPTWMHLIREEVAELFETETIEHAVAEAIQVAALCVSLVEHLYQAHEGDFQ